MIFLATALGGCVELHDQPAFLINERATPVSVSFTFLHEGDSSNAGVSPCALERSLNPILINHARHAYDRQLRGWGAAELIDLDPARCSAATVLPPGEALLLYWNGTCSDYAKTGAQPPAAPTLERLQITGGGPSILLTGFDTAKAFKASSRRKDCRLVIK